MLLIKTLPTTPKQRWKKYLKFLYKKKYFFYKYFFIKKNKKIKTKLIHRQVCIYKTYSYKYYNIKLLLFSYVIENFGYQKNPIKEFAYGRNIFNQIQLFLFSEYMFPGFKLYDIKHLESLKYSFINQLLPLVYVPLNSTVSYVFNNNNNKMSYAKSSGSNAFKRKLLKKTKLCYVEMPSKKLKLLPLYAYCVFSCTKNHFYDKIVEGGWGYTQKNKKKITVRGVAKNPVDHPNGGRTKAKQPELSPWGWVAKFNK